MQRYEAKVALENAREVFDRKRKTCPPKRLPINWMRYTSADRCIEEWYQEITAATGRDVTLDTSACTRLRNMPYENRHMYLRRLTDAVMVRNVRCPSAYFIDLLHADEYRSDYPWDIYRRPWIVPEC